jgi:hypothetical protein
MSAARKSPRTTARAKTAPPLTAGALPHLSAFLSGYLHQDFLLEYDTPADALAGFLAECSPAERKGLAKDWRMFAAAVQGRRWPAVRTVFASLGGAWRPPSKAALDRLFSILDGG